MRIVERFTRRDFGHIDVEMTFGCVQEAFLDHVHADIDPDTDVIEGVCNENERDRQHLVGQ
jgi:hypothetical protein